MSNRTQTHRNRGRKKKSKSKSDLLLHVGQVIVLRALRGRCTLRRNVARIHRFFFCVRRVLDAPNDDAGERERHEHQAPACQILIQERRRGSVHPERARAARGLYCLVEAREAREGERVVRYGAHDPIRERLVARVAEKDCRTLSSVLWHCRSREHTHRKSRARLWRGTRCRCSASLFAVCG
jgi:hypothetical protein